MSISSLQAGVVTALTAQIAAVSAAAESAAIDPRAQALMEPIALSTSCCPGLRWGIALGAFAIPLLRDWVRPVVGLFWKPRTQPGSVLGTIQIATGAFEATAGLLRDAAAPIIIGAVLLGGTDFSIDCHLPEVVAALLWTASVIKRVQARRSLGIFG